MALQKVICNMRHQMHRMMGVSALRYSNEANINAFVPNLDPKKQKESIQHYSSEANINPGTFDPKNQEELEQPAIDTEYKLRGAEGQYKVRTKVVAIGTALPAEGAEVLKEGQKVFVRGRLGSKVERSPDGTSVVRSTHVVGRFITTL